MENNTLEDIIRTQVALPAQPSARGFYSLLCPVCNDRGHKGPRAGFKFTNGVVGYHCFNCDARAKFDPSTASGISNNMLNILESFGITKQDLGTVLLQAWQTPKGNKAEDKITKRITPKVLQLPPVFYPLSDAPSTDIWAKKAKTYLESRCVDWESYPFMLADITKDLTMVKWLKRLIIPIYNAKNELIFYQGRDLTDEAIKKYQNPSEEKNNVIFGFDKLFNYATSPLYVVEGWFDAFPIDGIALIGNTITEEQAIWLNKSRRPKVYIPDKFGDGKNNALLALDLGWKVSTPDTGDCKDISNMIVKYGKLYTMKTIMDNIADGFIATTKIEMYCK